MKKPIEYLRNHPVARGWAYAAAFGAVAFAGLWHVGELNDQIKPLQSQQLEAPKPAATAKVKPAAQTEQVAGNPTGQNLEELRSSQDHWLIGSFVVGGIGTFVAISAAVSEKPRRD